MNRSEILAKAKECVCGQREQDYGSPEDNFTTIARLWTAYYGHEFTALDVSMMMGLLKIARIKSGTATDDSFVDLAGYAACGGEIVSSNKCTNARKNMNDAIDRMFESDYNKSGSNPVQNAYDVLLKSSEIGEGCAIEEATGFLGEALA